MPSRAIYAVAAVLIAVPMFVVADGALLDPTRPDQTREAAPLPSAEFEVTAIFFSKERKHAVVNGQLVAQGDQVDGAKVILIRPNALELRYRGRSITRRLRTAELGKL